MMPLHPWILYAIDIDMYLHEVSVLETDGDEDDLAVDRELSVVGVRVVHVGVRLAAGGPRRVVDAHCTLVHT